jgi:hypothetical protein
LYNALTTVNDIPRSIETEKVILLVDNTIKHSASDNKNDIRNGKKQQPNLYHDIISIATFKGKSMHHDLEKYPMLV